MKRISYTSVLGSVVLAAFVALLYALPSMAGPCSEPPFVSTGIANNALIVLDASGSMGWSAYQEKTGRFYLYGSSGEKKFFDTTGQCTRDGNTYNVNTGSYCAGVSQSTCNNRYYSPYCQEYIYWNFLPDFEDEGYCRARYRCRWNSTQNKCNMEYMERYCTKTKHHLSWFTSYSSSCYYKSYGSSDATGCEITLNASISPYTKYDPSRNYYGYFKSDKLYKYDKTKHYWYTEDGWDTVDPNPNDDVPIKGACLAGGACDKYSGNWLNWVTALRMDVAKKVLTGGKLGGDKDDWVLVGVKPYSSRYYKLFLDDGQGRSDVAGSSGVYYTPMKRGLLVYLNNYDSEDRSSSSRDNDVPLFTFFKAHFYKSQTDSNYRYYAESDNGDMTPIVDPNNPGEPKTNSSGQVKRDYDDSYYFAVKTGVVGTDTEPRGVVQKVQNKVRLGYMRFYSAKPYIHNRVGDETLINASDADQEYSSGDKYLPTKMVRNINEVTPSGGTPLATTLREAIRYFKQQDPCTTDNNIDTSVFYTGSGKPGASVTHRGYCPPLEDGTIPNCWDPYDHPAVGKHPCTEAFIILVSDGDPTSDYVQKCNYSSDCDCASGSACGDQACVNATFPFDYKPYSEPTSNSNKGLTYLDDVAYMAHTTDIRPDIGTAKDLPIKQSMKIYGIYIFGSSAGEKAMMGASLAGGFPEFVAEADVPKVTDIFPDNYPDDYKNFLAADDGYLLETYLASIFDELSLGGAASAVATISQEQRESDLILRAAFDVVDPIKRNRFVWRGHLELFWPDGTGTYEFQYENNYEKFCSTITDTHCASGACCWDAGTIMKNTVAGTTYGNGLIFTFLPGAAGGDPTQVELLPTNAAQLKSYMRAYTPTNPAAGVMSTDKATAIIQWVRGKVNEDGKPETEGGADIAAGSEFRDREGFRMGDIVYSTPVIVGPPTLGAVSRLDPNVEEYWAFRNARLHREKVIYVGANDGMIHAILMSKYDSVEEDYDHQCTDCGKELWAFVPSNLLGELYEFTKRGYGYASGCKHRTMVDLAPMAFDVYIKVPSRLTSHSDSTIKALAGSGDRSWRTVIIGGERGGGDTYFALDITDPYNPFVIWEHSVIKNLAVLYENAGNLRVGLPFAERDTDLDGYEDVYHTLKTLAMTWAEPAVGRVKIPTDVRFKHYGPDAGGTPVMMETSFTSDESARHVAFIGSGFRLYEPTLLAVTSNPDLTTDFIKRALNKPHLAAIDVETGVNLWQMIWAMLVKARIDDGLLEEERMLNETTGDFYIPWAMGHPILLDLWRMDIESSGEDGFVDRLYVGDLRGNFLRLGLNFTDDPSIMKGARVDQWYTKPITAKDTPTDTGTCDRTNTFRACRQPITVPPTISFDRGAATTTSASGAKLRIQFGTGKFDDISGSSDDKSDVVAMSFYNLRDAVKYESLASSPTDPWEGTPEIKPTGAKEYTYEIKSVVTVGGANHYVVEVTTPVSVTSTDPKLYTLSGTKFGVLYAANDPGFCNSFNTSKIRQCTETCLQTAVVPGEEDDQGNPVEVCVKVQRDNCNEWWHEGFTGDCGETEACCRTGEEIGEGQTCPRASNKPNPCWSCIFDFGNVGERVLGKAAVRGGRTIFTTFAPPTEACTTGGQGWLYVLDYRCQPFPEDDDPVTDSGKYPETEMRRNDSSGKSQLYGVRVNLGTGMPSRPVLDSKGEKAIVQRSDAVLLSTGVDTSLERPLQFRGWRQR
ncbi:pilus assembly protein [Thermodesulfobacteriota bacterium]